MCKSLHMNNSNPHSPHVTPRIVMYVNVRLCQEEHECIPWSKLKTKARSSQLVSTLYPKMLSLCRVCSSAAFYIVLFSFLPQSVEITKGRIICQNFLFLYRLHSDITCIHASMIHRLPGCSGSWTLATRLSLQITETPLNNEPSNQTNQHRFNQILVSSRVSLGSVWCLVSFRSAPGRYLAPNERCVDGPGCDERARASNWRHERRWESGQKLNRRLPVSFKWWRVITES